MKASPHTVCYVPVRLVFLPRSLQAIIPSLSTLISMTMDLSQKYFKQANISEVLN